MSEIERYNFQVAWPTKPSSGLDLGSWSKAEGLGVSWGHGLSPDGKRQFLAGDVVTQLSDRQRLVQILAPAFGLSAGERTLAVGMLLPAAQSARAAPRRRGTASNPGLTATGAMQFAACMPVTNPDDRACLLAALDVALGN